jgi:hypothetical protein
MSAKIKKSLVEIFELLGKPDRVMLKFTNDLTHWKVFHSKKRKQRYAKLSGNAGIWNDTKGSSDVIRNVDG